ncbi:MAG TPA: hypothetical protein PKA07_06200 [Micropruina sp.]|nr:hypothetical protein [Micropruina sp.]
MARLGVRGVTIDHQESPTREESVELYTAVGWSAYTRDPDALMRAVRGSRRLVTALCDGELIGLARIVGDGVTIVYRSRPNQLPGGDDLGESASILLKPFRG